MSEIVERNGVAYELVWGDGCEDCGGTGAEYAHRPSCGTHLCVGNGDEYDCGGEWMPCGRCGDVQPVKAAAQGREQGGGEG